MGIKVSIVTVCLNSKNCLEQAMRSVFYQNYDNIEYIVIDGGSTDGTLDIIKKYERNITYWVSERDKGIYDAMNKGVAKATGDIIGFMNSDDWYETDSISTIVATFSASDADIVYGDAIRINGNAFQKQQTLRLKDLIFGMNICHQASFTRSKLLRENPFDTSYKISADYNFFLKMYFQGKKFRRVDAVIAFYRLGGISSNPWKNYIETRNVSLKLSKENVSAEFYQTIRRYFKDYRFHPLLFFLMARCQTKQVHSIKLLLEKYDFILFGAGKMGHKLLVVMRHIGLNVIAFWDSNKSLYDVMLGGMPVQSPHPKEIWPNNTIILVASKKANESISARLSSLGYINGQDFFDVWAWLGWVAKVWLGRI
ncbi:MAG: glycosyltransferase [Selenomonadaceae bacterium]|nr:glycosyltransferase [Selenomonadaceae bacterium]